MPRQKGLARALSYPNLANGIPAHAVPCPTVCVCVCVCLMSGGAWARDPRPKEPKGL
jgi:hypothetical protein